MNFWASPWPSIAFWKAVDLAESIIEASVPANIRDKITKDQIRSQILSEWLAFSVPVGCA